jgi:hypothetical protein
MQSLHVRLQIWTDSAGPGLLCDSPGLMQDQNEILDRAQGRYHHVAASPAVEASVPRVKAALLQESNRAMVEELARVARDFPALGVLDALQGAGVAVPPHLQSSQGHSGEGYAYAREASLSLDFKRSMASA